MRAGKLKSLFIVAATAFSAAGCSHMPGPEIALKTSPSARESKAKEPLPLAPIPDRLFIDAAKFSPPSSGAQKNRQGTVRIAFGTHVVGPYGFLDFCQRLPKECAQVPDNGPAKETPALLELARRINLEVNRGIAPVSDLEQYGQEEFWTYPESGKGDCEDYVLLKRRRLIAEGVPPEALLIAVVTAKSGEGHAVLVLHTDKNDYVLNNLTEAMLPWTETDFQGWKKITSPGNPFVWRDIPQDVKRDTSLAESRSLKQQQDAPRQAVKTDDSDDVARRPFKPVVVKPL